MYRKCVTEVSVLHQKQVEEALLELMGKMPYEDISVTALCQTAGITRRVFYHLFNNKTDALHAMIDHTLLKAESWGPEIREPALRFFLYWKEHRQLLDVLQTNQLSGLLLERMIESVMREDYDLRYWLKLNGWERERDIVVFHLSGVMGLVYRWYFSNFRESPEEMAQLLNKIMTIPLAVKK